VIKTKEDLQGQCQIGPASSGSRGLDCWERKLVNVFLLYSPTNPCLSSPIRSGDFRAPPACYNWRIAVLPWKGSSLMVIYSRSAFRSCERHAQVGGRFPRLNSCEEGICSMIGFDAPGHWLTRRIQHSYFILVIPTRCSLG